MIENLFRLWIKCRMELISVAHPPFFVAWGGGEVAQYFKPCITTLYKEIATTGWSKRTMKNFICKDPLENRNKTKALLYLGRHTPYPCNKCIMKVFLSNVRILTDNQGSPLSPQPMVAYYIFHQGPIYTISQNIQLATKCSVAKLVIKIDQKSQTSFQLWSTFEYIFNSPPPHASVVLILLKDEWFVEIHGWDPGFQDILS